MPSTTNNSTSTSGLHEEAISNRKEASEVTPTFKSCTNGNNVTVGLPDGTFILFTQWLHDADCDQGAARNALTSLCQQPTQSVRVESVRVSGKGYNVTVDIIQDDGLSSKFPLPWLMAMAPLVAAKVESRQTSRKVAENRGMDRRQPQDPRGVLPESVQR